MVFTVYLLYTYCILGRRAGFLGPLPLKVGESEECVEEFVILECRQARTKWDRLLKLVVTGPTKQDNFPIALVEALGQDMMPCQRLYFATGWANGAFAHHLPLRATETDRLVF